jgi:hypothetical protein
MATDLGKLVTDAMQKQSGMKEALDALHPAGKEKQDRLSRLSRTEIIGLVRMEWTDEVLKKKDWTKEFILGSIPERVKALKVSEDGLGRHEVTEIMKPAIVGEMLGDGSVPSGMPVPGNRRVGFFQKFMGIR